MRRPDHSGQLHVDLVPAQQRRRQRIPGEHLPLRGDERHLCAQSLPHDVEDARDPAARRKMGQLVHRVHDHPGQDALRRFDQLAQRVRQFEEGILGLDQSDAAAIGQ